VIIFLSRGAIDFGNVIVSRRGIFENVSFMYEIGSF